jgi:spermidine synthase
LHEEFKSDCHITAIEKDPLIIDAGRKYFNTSRFRNLDIQMTDAFDYVINCKEKFDMVAFDIYIDNEIPSGFETREFLMALKKLIKQNGYLVFNKNLAPISMRKNLPDLIQLFDEIYPGYKNIWIGSGTLFFIYKS